VKHPADKVDPGPGLVADTLHEETLRSKSPSAVTQEIWGILLAYNLVRLEMERVAEEAGVEPTRISFVAALHLIVDEWQWLAVALPAGCEDQDEQLLAEATVTDEKAPKVTGIAARPGGWSASGGRARRSLPSRAVRTESACVRAAP
jgi:hypothetical protein